MRFHFLIGFVAALLIPTVASAADRTFKGVTLDVAKGWEAVEGDAGSLLIKRDYPETAEDEAGAALIQLVVIAAPKRSGALAEGVATMVGAVPGMKEEDVTDEGEGTTSNGYDMLTQYRCCGRVQDISAALTTVATGSDTRQAYLQMLTFNLDDEPEDDAENTFANMVRTLRLHEGDDSFALRPAAGDGGLDGVYTYLRTGLMPNVFGGMDFTSESEVMVFDPSGLFSDELPADMDLARHCSQSPQDCGTYRLSGVGFWLGERQIELRSVADAYGRIESETSSFQQSDDGLTIDDNFHGRLPAFPENARLDGTWRYLFASSGMTATSSGSIAVERTLTLTPDGRFERSGFVGASTSVDTGSGTSGVTTGRDSPLSAGTYRLDGYSLILSGADGQTETMSIFAPDVGSDGLLVINGANYLKNE